MDEDPFEDYFADKKRALDNILASLKAKYGENDSFSKRVPLTRCWNAEFFELINAQGVEWIAVQIHAGALLRIFDPIDD